MSVRPVVGMRNTGCSETRAILSPISNIVSALFEHDKQIVSEVLMKIIGNGVWENEAACLGWLNESGRTLDHIYEKLLHVRRVRTVTASQAFEQIS